MRVYTLLAFAVMLLLGGMHYITAGQIATAKFTIDITRTGADQAAARRALTEDLGDFAKSLNGDADIYQRNSDGSLILNGKGEPQYDRPKVEARIVAWLDSQIDGAIVSVRAGKRISTSSATITQEESDALRARKP